MICDRCIHKNVCKIEYDIHNCADFIELVRCKDCKYCESTPKWIDFELGCMLHREYTTATDFCSQAERKETKEAEHGEWINHIEYGVTTYISDKDVECSECGHRQPRLFDMNFCPNCGADMRERRETDE